jgi:predicted Zn finger-like uncharacterized protein
MVSIINCPSCARQLRVPEELIGRQVKCPSCLSTFTATAAEPAAVPPPPEPIVLAAADLPPAPPLRSADGPFAAMAGGGDDFQAMGDPDLSHARRRLARSRVGGPALAMMIVSGIVIGLLVLNLFLGVVMLAGAGAGGRRGEEALIGGLVRIVLSGMVIVYDCLIFFGAQQMRDMRSYGWAMAASIMSIVPFTGCCLLTIPFGIWGVVVLSDNDVKQSFRS